MRAVKPFMSKHRTRGTVRAQRADNAQRELRTSVRVRFEPTHNEGARTALLVVYHASIGSM